MQNFAAIGPSGAEIWRGGQIDPPPPPPSKNLLSKSPVKIGLKILSDVNNTEFVAILIRFLGTSALPFCLRWANTACALWRMFNTSKAKAQRSPVISRERREVHCARLYGYPCMLNMCHSAHVVLAQQKQNGSAPVPKNGMSITTNSVLLTIRPIVFLRYLLLRNKLECVIRRYFMEIISIYIFNIDKKSTLSEKVDMAIFFQWQYRQIEMSFKKTIYRNIDVA